MASYRNDLDAMRSRKEALEEELDEQRARAASEVAERDAEIAALRRQLDQRGPAEAPAKKQERAASPAPRGKVEASPTPATGPAWRSLPKVRIGLLIALVLFVGIYVALHGAALPESFALERLLLPTGRYGTDKLLAWVGRAHAMHFCTVLSALVATVAVWLPLGPTERMGVAARVLLLVAASLAIPFVLIAIPTAAFAFVALFAVGVVGFLGWMAYLFITRGKET